MTISPPAKASPWWSPGVHADRRPILMARARVMAAVRHFFAACGFVEVEPAVLQVSPGNEAHIAGFATQWQAPDGQTRTFYLHASPEFACKKLLAAGEPRIFALSRVFRNGERGPLHHPEFTILEWYRAGQTYETLMADCAGLLRAVAQAAGVGRLVRKGREADPALEPELVSVATAFSRYAGIDLLATCPDGQPDRDALAGACADAGIYPAADDSWSDLFSKVLVARVESNLGWGRPTILMDYPLPEAALARRSTRDTRVAERFELYACGVELANGFGELTDPVEQRRRFEAEMTERARLHGSAYPLDEDFLEALAIMPEASGIALGFDRLVMLLTAAERIDQVLWTPVVGC